jgi:hypothetical protein
VQEETRALERMSGASGATASPAVRDAVAAGLRWIAANAPETTAGPLLMPASTASSPGGQP